MNGKILDQIEQAIQKVLDDACEDEIRWPEFFCPPTLAKDMALATSIVFDCAVNTSQYQERESD